MVDGKRYSLQYQRYTAISAVFPIGYIDITRTLNFPSHEFVSAGREREESQWRKMIEARDSFVINLQYVIISHQS